MIFNSYIEIPVINFDIIFYDVPRKKPRVVPFFLFSFNYTVMIE